MVATVRMTVETTAETTRIDPSIDGSMDEFVGRLISLWPHLLGDSRLSALPRSVGGGRVAANLSLWQWRVREV